MVTHLVAYKLGGGCYIPKHHRVIHLTFNSHFAGNPSYYTTFEDEHENGVAAAVGRSVHPVLFGFNVLRKQIAMELYG